MVSRSQQGQSRQRPHLYFVNKLTKISETIADGLLLYALRLSASRSPTYIPASVGGTLDTISTVTIAEEMKLFESAPAKTSPFDILLTSIMKAFKEELAVMITNVANSSFRTATFPQSMKKGQVTPLLKKPGLDTTDFKNFRLITNFTTISKIIERLALQRLRPYLASSSNYCRLQPAYFTGRSA